MDDTISLKKIVKLLIMCLVITIIICILAGVFKSSKEKEFIDLVKIIKKDVIETCTNDSLEGNPHKLNYSMKDGNLLYDSELVKEYGNNINGNIVIDNDCNIVFNVYNEDYKSTYYDYLSTKKHKEIKGCSYKGELNIGTKVFCNDDEFDVISINEDNIKLLSSYNITTDIKQDEIDTSLESKNAIAFDLVNNRNDSNNTFCERTLYGCNLYTKLEGNFKNGDNEGTVKENSTVKAYVDKYGILLDLEDNLIDISMITIEELNSLGCDVNKNTCVDSEYSFIYNTTYWTSTYFKGSMSLVYRVQSDGYVGTSYANYANNTGVRPVITISKDILKNI